MFNGSVLSYIEAGIAVVFVYHTPFTNSFMLVEGLKTPAIKNHFPAVYLSAATPVSSHSPTSAVPSVLMPIPKLSLSSLYKRYPLWLVASYHFETSPVYWPVLSLSKHTHVITVNSPVIDKPGSSARVKY